MFLLNLGLRPWRKAFSTQLMSSLTLGILLILSGFLIWLQQSFEPVVSRLKHDQVVTAYVKSSFPGREETQLMQKVQGVLGSRGIRAEVRWVGVRDFIEQISGNYPELGSQLLELGPELAQVVPRYLTVSGTLSQSVVKEISVLPGIESVESSSHRFQHLVGAFETLRGVTWVLIVGMIVALFTGLVNLSKTNAILFRDAAQVMQLYGSSSVFSRIPVAIAGTLVGVLGGIIAAIGWMGMSEVLGARIQQSHALFDSVALPNPSLALGFLIAGTICGFFGGFFGGWARSSARS